MKCKSCKREIPDESIFCMHCGEKLIKERSKKHSERVPAPRVLADGTLFGQIMISGTRYPVRGKNKTEYEANVLALKNNVVEAEKPDNRTVKECLENYIAAREGIASPSTIDSYTRRSKNNLQSIIKLKVKDLTPEKMQKAINKDMKKYSGKTIHEAVSLVESATGLKFKGLVKPSKEPKKLPPVYSSEDIKKFILALAKIGGDVECAGLLAVWLSLRRSEIIGLKWTDIGKDSICVRTARVYDKDHKLVEKTTKNKTSTRVIPCDKYIINKINALPQKGEYVISTSTSGLWEGITKACDMAGIEHGYLHGLRHTNATVMEYLSIPATYQNKRGGWSKSHVRQTTYTDAMTEGEKNAAEKIDKFFNDLVKT